MALASGTIYAISSSATTANVNGSGFNPANTNFPTDLAGTNANTASPVVTSATYTFVSGDVGNWLYVKSGTNWTPGWYRIASVTTGAATLSAAIGAAILTISSTGVVTYNSLAGCATTASPTAGTYGVDYSQSNTANSSITDAASVGSSTTLTSATAPWTPVSVGNFFHLTTTGTGGFGIVGWYEIVSYNSAGSVVTDRTTNTGTALVAGTGQTGGAGNLNGLEDSYQAMLPAGAQVFVQNGSYTLSGAISTASSNGTATSSIYWQGFNVIRGDTCNGANRPVINAGANAVTFSTFHFFYNFIFNTTSANGFGAGASVQWFNCKFLNSSTTAARSAITMPSNGVLTNCEVTSQNGIAITPSPSSVSIINGCYIHDSANGMSSASLNAIVLNTIFEYCSTNAMTLTNVGNGSLIQGCTIYGAETPIGTGLRLGNNSGNNKVISNIFYGLATGINLQAGAASSNFARKNDFYNNTTDVTNWVKSPTDIALNPTFSGVSQVTGTAGQGLGSSTFQDTSKNFTTLGVVANQDFLHVISGGSLTAGCYLITAITTTTNPNDTLTLNNNPGTGAATAVYTIPIGHNFQIGTNLKAQGFPTFTDATNNNTTSYPDTGAVQRQESAAASGGSFTFVG